MVLFFGCDWAFCECMMVFRLLGSMKVVRSGEILMWQKRESHVSVSLGAWFIMIVARFRSLYKIVTGVRGLRCLWDLSISSLMKLTIMVRKEFASCPGKFIIAWRGCIISRMPIAFRMLEVMFQTGLTCGQW